MTCPVEAVLPPCPSMVMPPPTRTAARSPSRAAYRTGGESVKVTRFLSAAETAHLKEEGRGFPRPSRVQKRRLLLRAGAAEDVSAGAGLVPDLAADGALDAVRDRVSGLDRQLRRHDGRVVRLEQRDGHAGIACGSARAGVVGVEGLDRR